MILAILIILGLHVNVDANAKANTNPLASHPTPGQLHRYRGAPGNSLLSITPVDGAELLVNQKFDISIEIHSLTHAHKSSYVSKHLKATINHQPLNVFFKSNYTNTEMWDFQAFKDLSARDANQSYTVHVQRISLRSIHIPKQGSFHVTVSIGKEKVEATWTIHSYSQRKVKNLILFIGDGMAPTMISAARYISKSTIFGKFKNNFLSFEQMGTVGKIATNGIDSMITDSANSAAAYFTGNKGWVNSLNVYADTSPSSLDDPKVETLPEYLKRLRPDMCIGIVTTASVQDATPAAAYAHTRRRTDYAYITDQFIHPSTNDSYLWHSGPVKADVLMGGGGKYFCNQGELCSSLNHTDYYSLYEKQGYHIVKSRQELNNYKGKGPILGIFALNHLDTWMDRELYSDNLHLSVSHPDGINESALDQPGLQEMTMKAIEIMSNKCHDGFFLLSEAASIDKSLHAFDYERALGDLLELDRTVEAVLKWDEQHGKETGIIVTADHSQSFDVYGSVDSRYFNEMSEKQDDPVLQVYKRRAIGEYDEAGWPDLVVDSQGLPTQWKQRFKLARGKVESTSQYDDYQLYQTPAASSNPLSRKASVQDPHLTSLYGNKTVYVANPDESQGLYKSPNLHPSENLAVHSLQAVDLYCHGPDSFKIKCARVMDNTDLFFIMADALGLGEGSNDSQDNFISSNPSISLLYSNHVEWILFFFIFKIIL